MMLPAGLALILASSAFADTYQATGPVLELTDSKIIIEKGKEKWSFTRTPETKVTGELKVGEKVTIEYTMTAVSAEAKPAKEAKPDKPTDKTKTPAVPTTPMKKAS